MSTKPRLAAPAMIAATAVATAGIGLSAATPANASPTNGTDTVNSRFEQLKRPDPLQKLEQAVELLLRKVFPEPAKKAPAKKAAS
jgi:hypothetical protein